MVGAHALRPSSPQDQSPSQERSSQAGSSRATGRSGRGGPAASGRLDRSWPRDSRSCRAARLARPTPRRWRPSPSAVIPGAAGPAAPVGHWTLTAAPEKALAAAVAGQGRVDRGVRHPRAATTAVPELAPPMLVSASLSALVAISSSRLLVWWWLAHGEVEGQLVGAAIGQVHPLAAVWAHQVGRSRTAAKGLDDLLLLGRHLFTLPQLCSISTRCAGWPSTISQTMWGAMPLGMSAGRSPRRSHRILILQPRSCSWRSISPRTSLGGSSSSRRSSARLARASARSIRWFCTRFSRSCARRRGPAIAPGFCSPWAAVPPATACACSPT
jgi:hypothetical protein